MPSLRAAVPGPSDFTSSRPRFSPFVYLASTETETFFVGKEGQITQGYDWASKDYTVLEGLRLAFLAGKPTAPTS